jgi:hypothetical protein
LYKAVAAPLVENATPFGYEYKGNAVVDELVGIDTKIPTEEITAASCRLRRFSVAKAFPF